MTFGWIVFAWGLLAVPLAIIVGRWMALKDDAIEVAAEIRIEAPRAMGYDPHSPVTSRGETRAPLSSTDATVQVGTSLTSDRVWRLSISLESGPSDASVRVVGCEAVPVTQVARSTDATVPRSFARTVLLVPVPESGSPEMQPMIPGSD
jgi:hypothetical protein